MYTRSDGINILFIFIFIFIIIYLELELELDLELFSDHFMKPMLWRKLNEEHKCPDAISNTLRSSGES